MNPPYYYNTMNTYHHHNLVNLQPQYYYMSAYPAITLTPPPPLIMFPAPYTIPVIYSRPLEYVDEVAVINNPSNAMWVPNQNPHVSYPQPEQDALEFGRFLEEGVILHDLEVESTQRAPSTTRGSGLQEEVISKSLLVYTLQGHMVEKGDRDSCSICLGEYEEDEKIGRVECGHRFHANCIKQWLKSKNECPLCRSTALTV